MFELPALPQFAGRDAAEATRIRTVVLAYLNAELAETRRGLPQGSPCLPILDLVWRECCATADPAWWSRWFAAGSLDQIEAPYNRVRAALYDKAGISPLDETFGPRIDKLLKKGGFSPDRYRDLHSPLEFLYLSPRAPMPDDLPASPSWRLRTPPCGPFPADGGTWIYLDTFIVDDDLVTAPAGSGAGTRCIPSAMAVSSRLLAEAVKSVISGGREGTWPTRVAVQAEEGRTAGNLRVLSFFASPLCGDLPGCSPVHGFLGPKGSSLFRKRLGILLDCRGARWTEERRARIRGNAQAVGTFLEELHVRLAMSPGKDDREEPWL